jgi:Sec-independent protein translocase protein TatA
MEFLGIGPLELFFIILIALIVLGPKDMVKAGRTVGRFLRTLVTSPTWRSIQQTSRELRYLPNRLMREAGLEDLKKDLPEMQTIRKDIGLDQMESDMKQWQKDVGAWAKPADTVIDSPPAPELNAGDSENPEQLSEPAAAPQPHPEITSTPDLSAWTTPAEPVDAAQDGKNTPPEPAPDSNPNEINPKTTL